MGIAHGKKDVMEKLDRSSDFLDGMEEYDLSYCIIDAGYSIVYSDKISWCNKESPLGRKPKKKRCAWCGWTKQSGLRLSSQKYFSPLRWWRPVILSEPTTRRILQRFVPHYPHYWEKKKNTVSPEALAYLKSKCQALTLDTDRLQEPGLLYYTQLIELTCSALTTILPVLSLNHAAHQLSDVLLAITWCRQLLIRSKSVIAALPHFRCNKHHGQPDIGRILLYPFGSSEKNKIQAGRFYLRWLPWPCYNLPVKARVFCTTL